MRSLVLGGALAGVANASPMTVTGDVLDVRSRWTSDGSRIVTEATVRSDVGDLVVSQLGGSVDGLAMRSWPGPELLVPGELYALQRRIEIEAERLGYARDEQRFSPHLTLGRLARNASVGEVHQIGEILEQVKVESLGEMQVQGVKLYKSDLQSTGAVYTCLYTAHLR